MRRFTRLTNGFSKKLENHGHMVALYFTHYTRRYGRELWKSDGTWAGTRIVKDIYPGHRGSKPYRLIALGSRIFFVGQLGKYLPGSLWALLVQMELSRKAGIPRSRGLAGSGFRRIAHPVF